MNIFSFTVKCSHSRTKKSIFIFYFHSEVKIPSPASILFWAEVRDAEG